MEISIGKFTARYDNGVISVTHPALPAPAEFLARPFDFCEPGSDQEFDCESQLRDAIDYTHRKFAV